MATQKTSISDSRQARMFEFNDAVQTAVMLATAVPALLLPERYWPTISATVADLSRLSNRRRFEELQGKIETFFPRNFQSSTYTSLLDRITARHVEENMIYTRLYWRPAWRPRLNAHGLDDLAGAIAKGGVVLWCVNQTSIVMLLKLLMHDAGYPLHHVRNWAHGPTPTRYGRRVVNPMFWKVEDRYARHLVVRKQSPLSMLRAAGRLLREGGIVSFRSVDDSTRRVVLPMLGGWMKIALGAPRTALKHNAALIAVHCRPDGPAGWEFTFTPLGRYAGRSVESVTEEFRQICERAFTEAPELWPVRHRQFLTEPP